MKGWSISVGLTFLCGSAVSFAGLPGSYSPISFEKALAESDRDGRPVMVYFTSSN